MRRSASTIGIAMVGLVLGCSSVVPVVEEDGAGVEVDPHGYVRRPPKGACGLADPAFCDTFGARSPGGRGGELDERIWSVARVSNETNPPQGNVVGWGPTSASACGQLKTGLLPDDDVFLCTSPTGSSLLAEALDDWGTPALLGLRVRQPLDFSGRTATIALGLDAGERTPGGHGYWWQLVISEEPVPAPYRDHVSHFLYAKNALVLEFQGLECTMSGTGSQNALSRVTLVENYAEQGSFLGDQIEGYECFDTAEGVLNRLEVRLSTDSVEVWATDLDATATLRPIGRVSGLGLGFSRGYVSFEHAQFMATQGGLDSFHTYHLDELGFDGPSLPRPRGYELPDARTAGGNAPPGFVNLGYALGPTGAETCCDWTDAPPFVFGDVDLANAVSAHLTFTAQFFVAGTSIEHRFNGGPWRSLTHAFPSSNIGTRTLIAPVELADLGVGDDVLELRSNVDGVVVGSVDLEVVPQ